MLATDFTDIPAAGRLPHIVSKIIFQICAICGKNTYVIEWKARKGFYKYDITLIKILSTKTHSFEA